MTEKIVDETDEPIEQMPMNVVLSEIRKMLTEDIREEKTFSEQHFLTTSSEPQKRQEGAIMEEEGDCFLLTSEMRCDNLFEKGNSDLSESVQKKTQLLLDKLARLKKVSDDKSSDEINNIPSNDTQEKPSVAIPDTQLTQWLNRHLPEMLEKIVAQELQKALFKNEEALKQNPIKR